MSSITSSANIAKYLLPSIEKMWDESHAENNKNKKTLREFGITSREINIYLKVKREIDYILHKEMMEEYDKQLKEYCSRNDGVAKGFRVNIEKKDFLLF